MGANLILIFQDQGRDCQFERSKLGRNVMIGLTKVRITISSSKRRLAPSAPYRLKVDGRRVRRRRLAPTKPNPLTINAQLAGSGTVPATLAMI